MTTIRRGGTAPNRATQVSADPAAAAAPLPDLAPAPRDPVLEALGRILSDGRALAGTLGTENAALWEEIGRAVRGGKQFRARLVTRTHAGLGGEQPRAAAQVAAAFELMHAGFLVHDDLIDHDTMRRGQPNLASAMYQHAVDRGVHQRAERFATASALLAGDLLLGMAQHAFATVEVPAPVHARLQTVFAETLFVSVAGELDDVAFELREVSRERAMKVAQTKTAMYSFQAPFRAAAILAEADEAVLAQLHELGHHLGVAFQLGDDLLGTFAPEAVIGKSNISDLREGKCTTLLLHARGMPVWSEIGDHVGRPDLDEPTAAVLRRALAASDAPQAVRTEGQGHLDDIARALDGTALPAALAELVAECSTMIGAMLDDAWGYVCRLRADGDVGPASCAG
jgi:geranylgeranyl pyrophosphate synthase